MALGTGPLSGAPISGENVVNIGTAKVSKVYAEAIHDYVAAPATAKISKVYIEVITDLGSPPPAAGYSLIMCCT